MGTLIGISGIYAIINSINNKVYVGKSINIGKRWSSHKYNLKVNSKDCNRHLKNSVLKYGIENFRIELLEEINILSNEDIFKEKELFWMDYLNTCSRQNGYNLRRDSSTGMKISNETRELKSKNSFGINNPNYGNKWSELQKNNMSLLQKDRYNKGLNKINYEALEKGRKNKLDKWIKFPETKKLMAKRVSNNKSKYDFLKIDRNTLEIVEEFNTFMELKEKYPNVGKIVIFSVCNGSKKSYLNYYWRYRCKKTGEIIKPKGKYKDLY